MQHIIRSCAAIAAAIMLFFAPPQVANAFPDEGLKLIVAYGAGGGTDVTARLLAKDLEATIGHPVTVENVTGGGGWTGWSALANAQPDGYTIGYINVPNIYAGFLNPEMSRSENLSSFTPLMNHVTDYCVWAVSADSPFHSVADVIEAAKADAVSIAAHGFGGDDSLAILRMQNKTDASFNVIHNTSTAISLTQVLGGHVQVLGANVSEVIKLHEAGELRVIGVMAPERSKFLPDVPTFKEQGFDQVWSVSRGIAAPAGLPDDVKQILIKALKETLSSDAHRNAAEQLGLSLDIIEGKEYAKFLADTEGEVKTLMGW